MKYKIIYDKKGRLRVRFGSNKFTNEQGYGICELVSKIKEVESTYSTSINGGILIHYRDNVREEILGILDGLNSYSLSISNPTQTQIISESNRIFQNRLAILFMRRIFAKYFLPAPVRWLYTIFRSMKFIKRGWDSLIKGAINVDVLDSAAITAALFHKSIKTASSIMFLLSVSDLLSEYTRFRVNHVLTQSLAINVDTVWLVTDEGDISIPIKTLETSDCIRIRTGNIIPIDGVIVSGEASVNESTMTGEPLPVLKAKGKTVFAGTALEYGSIVVKVTNTFEETRIAKILEMISNSEQKKASVQSKMEHFADKIVPLNFCLFAGVLLFTRNIHKALSVLMVDYSCALKLTTPICIISAMRQSAENGILIKGGKYLESFANADTIVFDKTGTLTTANPKVAFVISLCELPESEILRISACLEEHFPHSVANAIVKKAKEESLLHEESHTEVEYIVAHGISTKLHGEKTIIGSFHFIFEDEKVYYDKALHMELSKKIQHYSPIYLAKNNKLIGVICIDDPPREEAPAIIEALRENGIKNIIMLTGDNHTTAKAVSEKLGIDSYFAEVLPGEKANKIMELKAKGHNIIMVGDGVNDTPALSEAHVSVTLNDASDIAKEVSDITILNGNLEDLLYIRNISKSLISRIRNNYKIIIGFNSLLLLAGLNGVIKPVTSSFFHNSSTLLLTAYSTRKLIEDKKIIK